MAATKWHAAVEITAKAAKRQTGEEGVMIAREAIAILLEAAKVGANAIGYEYAKYTEPDMHAAEMFYRAYREGALDVARAEAEEWSRKHRPIATLD